MKQAYTLNAKRMTAKQLAVSNNVDLAKLANATSIKDILDTAKDAITVDEAKTLKQLIALRDAKLINKIKQALLDRLN